MGKKEFSFKKFFQKWDKSQWLILVLAGVLLMVIAIPTEDKGEKIQKEILQDAEEFSPKEDYQEELEKRLKETLSQIEGAGRVEVMLTLADAGESVVEKDTANEASDLTETDDTGGSRVQHGAQKSQETVYEEEGNAKTPFVGKELTPRVAGVLVVAEGGENTAVKQNISEAVMALFQIEVNRIKVVKMKIQEEGY